MTIEEIEASDAFLKAVRDAYDAAWTAETVDGVTVWDLEVDYADVYASVLRGWVENV